MARNSVIKMEEKIYKEIAIIQERIISGMMWKAKNSVEYHQEKPEDLYKTVSYISDKTKWDYCGISNTKDLIELELLEKLIHKNE